MRSLRQLRRRLTHHHQSWRLLEHRQSQWGDASPLAELEGKAAIRRRGETRRLERRREMASRSPARRRFPYACIRTHVPYDSNPSPAAGVVHSLRLTECSDEEVPTPRGNLQWFHRQAFCGTVSDSGEGSKEAEGEGSEGGLLRGGAARVRRLRRRGVKGPRRRTCCVCQRSIDRSNICVNHLKGKSPPIGLRSRRACLKVR